MIARHGGSAEVSTMTLHEPPPMASRPRSAPEVGPKVLSHVLEAARLMEADRDGLIARLADHAAQYVAEDIQQGLRPQFQAGIEGNTDAILQLLMDRVSLANVSPVPASVEYAVRLAHRGVPAHVLLSMYQVGQDQLLEDCFAAVESLQCPADMKMLVLHHMSGVIYRFIEWMGMHLIDIYEREREVWSTTSGNVRYSLVQRVIGGADVEQVTFERETGYRLDQHHVGLVVWIEPGHNQSDALRDIERGARALATALGTKRPPLFAAVDRGTAWIWLPRGRVSQQVPADRVIAAFADIPGCHAAIGRAAANVDGFRRTHRQAKAARSVAIESSGLKAPVIGFGDHGVAIVSMLTGELAGDMDAVRDWVREVLGPLAVDTEANARLRETLLAFLESGCSYVTTAARLSLHRNSVTYRVQRAIDMRDRSIDDDRLDLELALRLAAYLGGKVLRSSKTG
jgi:hypothetical protein